MKPPRSLVREYPHIKSCTDAKHPINVTVTVKDVKSDGIMSLSTCAMAKAMCREWKADNAIIGLSYSYILKGSKAIRFRTPESVQREIVSYDRGAGFKPGKYYLAKITGERKLKTLKAKKSGVKAKGSSHRPKRIVHETLSVRSMRRNDWKE